MAALITGAQALAFLPNLTTAEASAVPGLCSAATRSVEGYCRRKLAVGSYLEYHRPGPTRQVRLKNPPVIPGTLALRADFAEAIGLTCADPAAGRATATLSATALTLARYSAASGSAGYVTPLALSGYATCSQLAVAVAGSGGWMASVASGLEDWLVSDLEPNPGPMGGIGRSASLYTYARDLSGWAMDLPEVGTVELAEDLPEAFRYADRAYSGYGGGSRSGSSDPRAANVRCSYQAGYDPAGLAGPAVPEDLQLAVALTIRALLDLSTASGVLARVSLGNTSFEVGEAEAVPAGARRLLSTYILRRI